VAPLFGCPSRISEGALRPLRDQGRGVDVVPQDRDHVLEAHALVRRDVPHIARTGCGPRGKVESLEAEDLLGVALVMEL
jgi:hypothetical protein